MNKIEIITVTRKEVDLSAAVTLMGYQGSSESSGVVNISLAGDVIHTQELNIDGDNSEETVQEILKDVILEFRTTISFRDSYNHYRSLAKEFYPIFEENDPFAVLEKLSPGFPSIEEVYTWTSREFEEGTPFAIINEFGQLIEWNKVKK